MKKLSQKAQIESCYVVNINECCTKIMDLRDLREVAIPIKIGKSDYFNFSGRGIEMTWKKARTSFIYFSHMHIFFAYAMVFGCTIHTFHICDRGHKGGKYAAGKRGQLFRDAPASVKNELQRVKL